MNRTTPLLLSLLLLAGAAHADQPSQESSGSTFSVDAMTFNLDWDDKQFGWSQKECLDLGVNDYIPSDCKGMRVNVESEENRNQPPSTNQMPTPQGNSQ
uniref:hypothetical protein n=1 Tax=Aeromonas jandaei TaxID=650 RepID=UPI003BA06FC9